MDTNDSAGMAETIKQNETNSLPKRNTKPISKEKTMLDKIIEDSKDLFSLEEKIIDKNSLQSK